MKYYMSVINTLTSLCIGCLCVFSSCASRYDHTKSYRASTDALEYFGQISSKQYGLRFAAEATYIGPNNEVNFMSYSSTKDMKLDQGRMLAIRLANDYTAYNLSNLALRKPFIEAYAKSSRTLSFENFAFKQLGFRISFGNIDGKRPELPYLAEIQLRDKTFYYYEANPETQALELIFEESYDDAIIFKNANTTDEVSGKIE